jgi:hypothetical protein
MKLRAYHSGTDKMYDVEAIDWKRKTATLDGYPTSDLAMAANFEDVKVMLSTEENDKLGKEVFEGDVVFLNRNGQRIYMLVSKGRNPLGMKVEYKKWRVMGDIHRNPELISKLTF